MTDKADSRSANHAHDQETQTNFDINTNNSVRAANNHTQRQLSQVSRMHSSFPFRHPPSPAAWNRGYYYPPSAPYSEHCYSPYEGHYPSPHGHPSHYTYPIPQWHQPTSPVLGPNVPVHNAIRRQGYPMDGYHHPYYNLHNSMAPPGVNAMISHEPTTPHQEIEIARPKPEWPSGHGPHTVPSKFSVLPSDYLRAMSSRGAGTECTGPPSTATSLRSTEIEFSANMSAAPSPRQTRKLSRKRALSNSPCSIDALDLNSIIRYSPDALLAYVSGSRASSASSFGHLITPIALSPANPRTPTAMPPCPVRQNPFITPHGPPLQSPTTTTTTTNQKDVPSSTTNTENDHEEDMSCTESVKASSTHETESAPVVKDEAMEECQLDSTTSPSAETKQVGSDAEADYVAGEGDHQELVCQWKDCNTVFESQEELVKHANGDHIKKERKDFTCYWKDCSREQKPFKAQYMLVVHMRRHTGEKPHKCSFEGCSKAYSRLENLKTHLRSHTGERPYECEVEGCNKAFSNASDRAKHQNRTHSSVKPYVCKVPGCTKRYTDPSSLRKHTKTVHGDQGVKKLKTDNHKEKPPQDQGRKNAPSGKPSQTANNVCCNSKNPNSVQTTQIKSVIKETRSRETKGSSYSGHVTGNSCDSDTVSSSCELSPGPADSSGSMGMALSVTHSTRNSRRSPRSPLIPNHLPDILEAEPCDNAVTTVQQVISVSQSHGHLLPKLESKGRDVETWVRDVSRRMSDVTSKPNETGNPFESDGDMSRRSSGWSSYNDSRRSSLASPSPAVSMQKNCGIDFHHQINTTSYSKRQGCDFEKSSLQLTEMSDSNLVVRRSSEASMLSAPGNRLSRNSSGYGSQSNLAFLKLPPLNRTFSPPNGRFHANQTHRRLSDTVICEADSSGMYMNSQGRELRRRSEPPGQVVGTSTRQEPLSFQQPKPLQNFKETNEMKERTPIAEPCIDPRNLDLFRTPQHTDHNQLNGVADAQPQTQRLRHYPYTEETVFDQQQHQQEVVSQVIHHRPNSLIQPKPLSQPKPRPHHMPNAPMPTTHQGDLQKSHQLLQQKLYSVQQQQQQGTQNDIFAGYSNQKQNEYNAVYPEVVPQQYPNGTVPSGVSYEDLMVDRMGALSTEADPTEQTFNAGNMVINHMDTLLNSLAEEDKYLDLTNCSRIASALSGTMF